MMEFDCRQTTQWRVSFTFEPEGECLAVRSGQEGHTLTVCLGVNPTKEILRRAGAKSAKIIRELGGTCAVFAGKEVCSRFGDAAGAALIQGAKLALHEAPGYQSSGAKESMQVVLETVESEENRQILAEAEVLTAAVCFARDLVNAPANHLTPDDMARQMTIAAQRVGVETQVLNEKEIAALGMGALLTVGSSASHPPRLIVMRYHGGGEEAPIALVGKGVTCDTGGYCLKASSSMKGIKGDMAGAAAVCGAILALAKNHVPVNVVAVIPAAENRISPESYIPGDVIGSMAGKTIEVGNTDAEGRLILADAVTYAIQKEGAEKIVDIATLTGAVVAMFGFTTAGLLASDEDFYTAFHSAAQRSGEQYWRLPIRPEYQKMIESPIADLSNTSSDGCGTITAGLFIGAFTENKPWIHLDIAGTAWVDAPRWEYQVKGATGAGVTTLYELCRGFAKGEH